MPQSTRLTRIGFIQGVKTSFDPSSVPPNALWESRNVRADESGILRLRDGVKRFTPSFGNGSCQGAISAFNQILLAWRHSLFVIDNEGNARTIRNDFLSDISQPVKPVSMIRWSRAGSEIVYIFGTNGLYETDSIEAKLVTPYAPETGEEVNLLLGEDGNQDLNSGPSKSKFGILRASLSQRMVCAGDPDSPNTVYMSAPLDATYWPANQVIQLPDDGGYITGLTNWYGALIIFRNKDIWAFFGSDVTDGSAMLVLQDSSTGCIAPKSIVSVPGVGIVFLGPDNVYALTGVNGVENQAQSQKIGDDIRKYLKRAIDDGVEFVCAAYHDGEYRLCFPDAVEPERVFRLTIQNSAGWYIDTGPFVTEFFEHNGKLFGASRIIGSVYLFSREYKNDDGKKIPFYVVFRRESLGDGPCRVKRFYAFVISKSTLQHLSVSVFSDGENIVTRELEIASSASSDFIIGQSVIGQGQIGRTEPVAIYECKFRPSLKGHFVQVQISATQEIDEDIALLGYQIEYDPRGRTRGIRSGVSAD